MSGDGVASILLHQSTMAATSPPDVISMDDLIKSTATLVAIETANKQSLELFDTSIFRSNLQQWAGTGFQDSYTVYQLPIVTSEKIANKYTCSDGALRDIWEYIPFCLGYPINDLVATFQQRVSGMTFSFSLEETPKLVMKIHVSKSPA